MSEEKKEFTCTLCQFATTKPTEYMKHLFMEHDELLDEWRPHYNDPAKAEQTINILGL